MNNMFSLYWLWILLLIVLIPLDSDKLKDSKLKEKLLYVFLVFLILFVGLRYESVDYQLYNIIYESQSFSNISFPFYSDGAAAKEFLFASLISFFKTINLNYQSLLFTLAVISIYIKFYYIKKYSPYIILSFFIYFAFLFAKDMGQFRNATIAAILMIAIIPLVKRNLLLYLGIILFSSSLHIFSLVALPLYFLFPYLRIVNVSGILLVFSLLIFIKGGLFSYCYPYISVFGNVVSEKLTVYYKVREFEFATFNIFNLSLLFFLMIFMLFKDKVIKEKSFEEGLFVCFIYALLLYFMFPDIGTVGARSLNYLSAMPLAILIPVFINQIKIEKLRYISYATVAIYCIVLFYPTIKSMHIYQNYLFH